MGVFKLFSADSTSSGYMNVPESTFPNPDPSNWKIKRHFALDDYLLVEINYPDCINYGGNKILLFKNISYEKLISQKYIDPHFRDDQDDIEYATPVARFEPTRYGWNIAKQLMEILEQ